MKVIVNNKEKIVPIGCTVEMLAQIISIKSNEPVAIAIGEQIIEREDWKRVRLNDRDTVTIIKATCGG
ncbi:MAG: sulfur carrier protein ThiS [Bacteroidales bacterium]